MAEISPANGNQSLKKGGWEETKPSYVPTEECTLSVQIDGRAMEVNDSACCQTYAVAAGQSQFESDSPTDRHLQQKTHYSSFITGCNTTPPNASLPPAAETPSVSYAVDPSPVLMRMNTAPNDMTPSRSEKQPASSHPAYMSDALTKLANVCSGVDQQQGAVSANVTVVHACSEEVQRQTDMHIQLEGMELWQQFHSVDTEMIITRAGRYVHGCNFKTESVCV